MGCGVGGGFRFGARTAWHRFEAGGPGSVRLSASSSYDVMLFAFKTTLPRGAKGFGTERADLPRVPGRAPRPRRRAVHRAHAGRRR